MKKLSKTQKIGKLRVLELCSGTKSVSDAISKFYAEEFPNTTVTTVSVDINPRSNPDICADVIRWNYKRDYPTVGQFDIIWASPPCTHYSPAKTIGERNFRMYDAIVKRCFDIIAYYKPASWFLENPGGAALLEKRPFMKKYTKYINRCTYCFYGKPYKKQTNIWSNVPNLELMCCNRDTPCSVYKSLEKHLATVQGGFQYINGVRSARYNNSTTRLNDRYSVPFELIHHIMKKIK